METIKSGTDIGQSISHPITEKKQYSKPAIIHELKLETRAGSPLGPLGINPLDDATGILGTDY